LTDAAFRCDGGVLNSDGGVSFVRLGRLLPTNELSSQHKRPVLPLNDGHLKIKTIQNIQFIIFLHCYVTNFYLDGVS